MNKSAPERNLFMLKGSLAQQGYDWWWHNFTGINRTTGQERAFFIEYFICNPALGETRAVLGQLPEHKRIGKKPSYALVKVGTWGTDARQIHNFYPISAFSCKPDKLELTIGSTTLSETHMKGRCTVTAEEALSHPEYMCNAGDMEWDLSIHKKIAYNVGYGASPFFRKLNAFEMFWHAEGIKTEYSGHVTLDGEQYDVIAERSFGYADKNWGRDFTSPWLWISSCNLKSLISGKQLENSAVEAGGGRPKVFGVALDRKLLVGMYYEGTMYEYNFAKFWSPSKVDFRFDEGAETNVWTMNAENTHSRMELILRCPVSEMLLINYEAPNGTKLHNRLWNGGTGYGEIKLYAKGSGGHTLIDHMEMRNTGCEYGEY